MDVPLDVFYRTNLLGVFKLLSSTIAFFVFLFCIKRGTHLPAFKYLKYFALTMGLWDLLEGIFYLTPYTGQLPIIAMLFYIVIPFTSITFFYFCFAYVFPNRQDLIKRLNTLMIIPCITIIMIIIPPLNKYFIIFPGDVIFNPLRDTTRLYQPWFYIHTYYSYLLVLIGTFLLIYRIIRPGTSNPIQCLLINITSLTFIFVNAYNVFLDTEKILFIFPFLTIFCINIYFWTLYFDKTETTIYSGHGELVDTLKFPVFVTNKKNYVIYLNQEALKVTSIREGHVISPEKYSESFPDFIPHKFDLQNFINQDFLSTNMILIHKETGSLFYLHDHILYSQKGKKNEMGRMFILITISAFNTFFYELEQKAFTDSQSGCFNLHYLELRSREIQNQDNLPLTCIMCDLDNLKLVNDTMGHAMGDQYIQFCVEQIYSSVRKTDLVFRTGGDEFLILLPNTTEKKAKEISENISLRSNDTQNKYPFGTGISVGYSSINTLPCDIKTLIAEADKVMYQNKKKRKTERNYSQRANS